MSDYLNDHRQPPTTRRSRLVAITPILLSALVVLGLISTVSISARWRTDSGNTVTVATTARRGSRKSTSAASTTLPAPTSTSAPPTIAVTPVDNAPAAVAAVDALASSSVRYGVAILDRDTGTLTLGKQGATQFYSASVVKLFLVTDILHEQEIGAVRISAAAAQDIQRALSLSDDNAMDALWVDFNGPQAINQIISLAHLRDTRLPADTSQWGETLISARDVIAIYQYVLSSLNTADRNTVLGDLANAANTGADGFNQAFGLLNPPRTSTVKAKQGWMIYGSQMMLHTTGTLGSN